MSPYDTPLPGSLRLPQQQLREAHDRAAGAIADLAGLAERLLDPATAEAVRATLAPAGDRVLEAGVLAGAVTAS